MLVTSHDEDDTIYVTKSGNVPKITLVFVQPSAQTPYMKKTRYQALRCLLSYTITINRKCATTGVTAVQINPELIGQSQVIKKKVSTIIMWPCPSF